MRPWLGLSRIMPATCRTCGIKWLTGLPFEFFRGLFLKKTRADLKFYSALISIHVFLVHESKKKSSNDTTVFTYGCQAHMLNLVAKDLLADKGRSATSKLVVGILTTTFVLAFYPHKCGSKAPQCPLSACCLAASKHPQAPHAL